MNDASRDQGPQESDVTSAISLEINSSEENFPPLSPTETKLFYGIQYWVSIDPDKSQFTVTIGQGIDLIEEIVISEDRAIDKKELFRLAHQHAQKIIHTEGADALAVRFGLQG
jgi:hypothetical protein